MLFCQSDSERGGLLRDSVRQVNTSMKEVDFSLDDEDVPERSQELADALRLVPEQVFVFRNFKIRLDLTKISRFKF